MLRPKKIKNKNSRRTTDFPTIFYHSIPADKIKTSTPPLSPADLKKRQTLMWAGVFIVMAFLIGLWASTLTERLRVAASSADSSLWEQGKNDLASLFQENSQKIEQLKTARTILEKAVAASPPAAALNANQVEELKTRIENRH